MRKKKNGEYSVTANAGNEMKNIVSINKVIKKITKTGVISETDFAEIVSKFIVAEPYEDDLYYRQDKENEYKVFKGDVYREGFEVCFAIFDKEDCENDDIATLYVTDIKDLRNMVTSIAKFSEIPFEIFASIKFLND